VIRRSRFIATLAPAATVEEAKAFIDEVRAEHPGATHNCFAFVAGPPGSTMRVGMSDDGEPHGTAGRPMLDVLLHSGVGDVAVVVTRYFGGTKLGTGGLVRAYSGAVKRVLSEAAVREKVSWRLVGLVVEYPALEGVRRLCAELEAVIDTESFAEYVRLEVRVPAEHVERLQSVLTERHGTLARCVADTDAHRPGDGVH
jgi:uncharacterized YigZ family protein